MKYFAILTCLAMMSFSVTAQPLTKTAADGSLQIIAPDIDGKFKNPVSESYEEGFRQRYNALLKTWTGMGGSWKKIDQRRFFEGEKWSYPNAMMHVLAGNQEAGMKLLQAGDQPQAAQDHRHTKGIDLWAAFTLKGQARKYFQFGHLMEPAYKKKFEQAIDIWTKTHPRHTPHPVYKKYNPKLQGWGPNRFGHRQLDGRRTDNLFAMSGTTVYLFAEASGNEETRLRAKDEIYGYIWALYNIGHGEWDSTTYHPHVVAPYLTLYDYAKDPEVKMAAKAALDHFFTAAALKNHRNTFAGASKREYGVTSLQNFDAFAGFFWLYFPADGITSPYKEHDQLHGMASAYRPAPAIINLANRKMDLPVEILANKPEYENWKKEASAKPRTFETIYIAKTYTSGSALEGSGNGDMMPFRVTFDRGKTGTNCFTANSSSKFNSASNRDRVAQYKNLTLWLGKKGNSDFHFLLAEGGEWQVNGKHWFHDAGDTWLAMTPINLGKPKPGALTKRPAKKYPSAELVTATPGEASHVGFALEIQEKGGAYKNFSDFKKNYASKSKLDLEEMDAGMVTFTGTQGQSIAMKHQGEMPEVWRNGVKRNFDDPAEWAVWRTADRATPVVDLPWKGSGVLQVRAGGKALKTQFKLKGFEDPSTVQRSQLEGTRKLQAEVGFETK